VQQQALLYERAADCSYSTAKFFGHEEAITRVDCVEHVPHPGAAKN
jgi:hypothetical protein